MKVDLSKTIQPKGPTKVQCNFQNYFNLGRDFIMKTIQNKVVCSIHAHYIILAFSLLHQYTFLSLYIYSWNSTLLRPQNHHNEIH